MKTKTELEGALQDADANLFTAAIILIRNLDDRETPHQAIQLAREALQDAACEYAVAAADYHDLVGCAAPGTRHQVVTTGGCGCTPSTPPDT